MHACCIAIIGFGKQVKNVRPITIGEVIYQLIAHTLAIQFKDTFAEHFSPHQFGVAMSSGCEIMVRGVRVMLDLHPEWVVL
jgi:putative Ca2+/H+ antiporter (TMEM165/GDT1 family)